MSTLNVDKVDPSTGTALEIGTSGDTITVPSGATFVVAGTTEITGTNNVQRPNVNPLIINGDMAVAQRETSVTGSTAGGYLTCDRVNIQISSIGTYTVIQESLTSGNAFDDGFDNAWRIDCTTADASPSSSEYLRLTYRMETQDLSCFKKGTPNAQPYTLGFWVKSNKTGTAQVNLYDVINNRLVGDTYTIAVADTWEYKILNYPADTSGALGDSNAEGIRIEFALDAGSTYTGGAIPSAWETRANGDRSVSDLSLADSTDNDWAITGLQLEVGEYTSSTLPPFQFENYGDNLQRCERYFTRIVGTDNSYYQNGAVLSSVAAYGLIINPVRKRDVPTWTHSGTVGHFSVLTKAATAYVVTSFTFQDISQRGASTNLRVSSGLTDGSAFLLNDNGSGDTYIDISAEL